MNNKPFRIKLSLTNNTTLVPFDNQSSIIGALHKWLGVNNNKHGQSGEWNISLLSGGKQENNGFTFKNDGFIVISGTDKEFRDMVIKGIAKDRKINWGMSVKRIDSIYEYGNNKKFISVSPILLREQLIDKKRYITFNDKDADDFLTAKMKRVISTVLPDVNLEDFSIKFSDSVKDKLVRNTKTIKIHDIKNFCCLSSVIINGDKRAIDFCYYNGIGDSTGCGFGMLGVSYDAYRK